MQIKTFLLILIVIWTNVNANKTLEIDNDFVEKKAIQFMDVLIDSDNVFRATDILNKKMGSIKFSNNGFSRDSFWTRLRIKNISDGSKKIVLENPRAGMDKIDVYIFSKSRLIETYNLGDQRPLKNRSFQTLRSNFILNIEKDETYTIVSKLSTKASLELGWEVYTQSQYVLNEQIDYVILGIFVGFLIPLIVYTYLTYRQTKEKYCIFFMFFVINIIFLQLYLQGALYLLWSHISSNMDYNLYNITGFVSATLFNFFWYLLMLTYFSSFNKLHFWKWFFIFMIILLGIYSLIYFSAYFYEDLIYYAPLLTKVALVHIPLTVIFLIWSVYKKFFGALYFLLATLSGKLMFITFLLDIMGKDEISFLSKYGIFISGAFSALFLSLAIFKKLSLIQEESQQLKLQLEKQKKYAIISKTISFISHQWKHPVSTMGSIVMNLQCALEHEPKKSIESYKPQINSLNNTLHFINQTITDIQSLFQINNTKKEKFFLNELVDSSLKELERQISSYKIDIIKNIDQSYEMFGNKDLLRQVLFSIFENNVEILNKRKIKSPFISIKIESKNNKYNIYIEDNAGGIKQEPAEQIFETFITEGTQSCGLGLSIVKQIVELKFQGNISVENSNNGAVFKIVI
jgi:signal transduction histidine kinase